MKPNRNSLRRLTLSVAIGGGLASCVPWEDQAYIILKNESGRDVCFLYEDAPFACTAKVEAGDSVLAWAPDGYWGWRDFGGDLVRMVVLDWQQYEAHSEMAYDDMLQHVPVLQRYELEEDELERVGWRIVYPTGGTEGGSAQNLKTERP